MLRSRPATQIRMQKDHVPRKVRKIIINNEGRDPGKKIHYNCPLAYKIKRKRDWSKILKASSRESLRVKGRQRASYALMRTLRLMGKRAT